MKDYVIYARYWMGTTYKDQLAAVRSTRDEAEALLAEFCATGANYYIREEDRPTYKVRPRRRVKKA